MIEAIEEMSGGAGNYVTGQISLAKTGTGLQTLTLTFDKPLSSANTNGIVVVRRIIGGISAGSSASYIYFMAVMANGRISSSFFSGGSTSLYNNSCSYNSTSLAVTSGKGGGTHPEDDLVYALICDI